MAILRLNNKQVYELVQDLRDEVLEPKNGDYVHVKEVGKSFTWILGDASVDDGLNVITQTSESANGRWLADVSITLDSATLSDITTGTSTLKTITPESLREISFVDFSAKTFFGIFAGGLNTGSQCSFFGYQSGSQNTGDDVVGYGYNAGFLNSFNNVSLIGYQASADENGQLVHSKDGTIMARFSTSLMTDTRKWNLPDADGTFALTSDIPTDVPTTVKVSLTSAQLLALNTTPITAIASAGVGKVISIHKVIVSRTIGASYGSGASVAIAYGTTTIGGAFGGLPIDGTGPTIIDYGSVSYEELYPNQPLTIRDDLDTITVAGTGNVDLYITYEIITL